MPEHLKNRQAGFTLLEIVVVVTLVSMLSLLFLGAFQYGGRILNTFINGRVESTEVDRARTFLARILTHAFPVDPDRSGVAIAPFSGAPTEVVFTGAMDVAPGQDDLYRIRLWHDAAQAQLKISTEVDRNGSDMPSDATGSVILANVQALKFRYLDTSAGAANWQADWPGRADLPPAISVDIDFIAGSVDWAPLVVALPITGRQLCQFDPVSRRCR